MKSVVMSIDHADRKETQDKKFCNKIVNNIDGNVTGKKNGE